MSDVNNFEERLGIAREAFAALLAADAWIASAPAIPVITEQQGDVAAMINQALARLGLCIVVVAADGDSLHRTGEGGLSMRVRIVAQISEKVLLNQAAAKTANVAYRPALSAAVRVMKAVDRRANGLDVGRHITGLNEFALLDELPFQLLKTKTDVVYEVSALTTIEL